MQPLRQLIQVAPAADGFMPVRELKWQADTGGGGEVARAAEGRNPGSHRGQFLAQVEVHRRLCGDAARLDV
jgi:hypothetical protein